MVRHKAVWSFLTVLFAVSFGLNWIWEVAQMFFYEVKRAEIWRHILLYCTLATMIDVLVTIVSYGLLKSFVPNPDWRMKDEWKPYVLMALFGAIWAGFFEIFAKRLGLWSYNELMPVVPLIEVGLLPWLQLTLLMPTAL
jgi:hypothetical protein